jgi:hypothetical protein
MLTHTYSFANQVAHEIPMTFFLKGLQRTGKNNNNLLERQTTSLFRTFIPSSQVKMSQPIWMQIIQHKKHTKPTKMLSFKSRFPLCSCISPSLHSSHHSPPLKSKTTNIILFPKLSHTLINKLIIPLKLPPNFFFVNDNMTKEKIVFNAMKNDKNQYVHTITLRTFHRSFSIIVQCLMISDGS